MSDSEAPTSDTELPREAAVAGISKLGGKQAEDGVGAGTEQAEGGSGADSVEIQVCT